MSQECDLYPVTLGVAAAAHRFARALERLAGPLATLIERLRARLEDEAEELDSASRNRIEAAASGLERRALAACWPGARCCARSNRRRPIPAPARIT